MSLTLIPPQLNRKIGKVMHDFSMLAEGDRVLIAVSGGVDSLVLCAILALWQKKAPISFEIFCVHIDHGYSGEPPESFITPQLQEIGLSLTIIPEILQKNKKGQPRSCFFCSKARRKQLFDTAKELQCNKIAFGHHKDDLIETFLLNAFYSGNISTMRPRQDIFSATVAIIRPLAYIEKSEVEILAKLFKLIPVTNICPFAGESKREKVHNLLQILYKEEPSARHSLFAALSNVRTDYLL